MKSFCVLNGPLNRRLYEKIGASAVCAFGEKIGVAYSDAAQADAASSYLCDGIVLAGGTAENFGTANESRIPFLIENYSLSAAFFVGGESLISVYSQAGRPLDAHQEKMMAELIASDDILSVETGTLLNINSDYSYHKALVKAAQSLEGASADVLCSDSVLRNLIRSAMSLTGADVSAKPRFFISRSGFGVSACDESGRVHCREKLLDICCACNLKEGRSLTVPFSASPFLESFAESGGAVLRRSFEGGDAPWQTDGTFLVLEVLRNMALYGSGLSTLSSMLSDSFTVRKNFSCDMKPDDVADMIPCSEILTDGIGKIYARHNSGSILLTRCRNLKNYCMEISSADSETASQLALEIGEALLT